MKKSKYDKLAEDLRRAIEDTAYIEEDESIPDTGTCNLDTPGLFLNRWCEDKVKEAARRAGSYALKHEDLTKYFGKTYFTFGFPTHHQGEVRTRRAEAICTALTDMGYDVFLYQAMD